MAERIVYLIVDVSSGSALKPRKHENRLAADEQIVGFKHHHTGMITKIKKVRNDRL